jgi:hypothetical protein
VSYIPQLEIDRLRTSISEALDMAEFGEVSGGLRRLTEGLVRARGVTEEAEAADAKWGPPLVAQWEAAIERYARRYGSAPQQ